MPWILKDGNGYYYTGSIWSQDKNRVKLYATEDAATDVILDNSYNEAWCRVYYIPDEIPDDITVYIDGPGEPPEYATYGSAGADLKAWLAEPLVIPPGDGYLVPTGLRIALPEGYEAQIRPRSGLAFAHGLTVLNTPGTIDSDYRDWIGILLINHGKKPYTVNNGDRIAQMVIAPVTRATFHITDIRDDTERGQGGFGSSGI